MTNGYSRHCGAWLWCLIAMGMISVSQLPGQPQTAPVDTILHNGKILTVDGNFSIAEAVAIAGKNIILVGRDEEVLPLAGPGTLKIDLKGRTVVPGLIDTHLHRLADPGPYRSEVPTERVRNFHVDWRNVTRKEDVLNQLRGIMNKYQPSHGEWLMFDNSPNGVPQRKLLYDEMNRWDLDTVTPNNPVILTMGVPDENGLFLNSKAIDIVWKEHGEFIRKYGRFWLASDSRPDGHLEAPTTRLILNNYMPRSRPEEMAPGFRMMMDELNAQGLTAMSLKVRLNGIEAYKLLERRGEQTVRLAYGLGWDYFGSVKDIPKELAAFKGVIGTGSDINWVNSFAPSSTDGASTRACTSQRRTEAYGELHDWWPYGQCYTDNEFRGGSGRAASVSGNYFRDWIMTIGQYGLRLANDHVAGDRSAANLLTMIEEVQKRYGPAATKNWAFDHCTFMDPKDIPRAARLGIMFSCAPKYIVGNSPSAAKSYGDLFANNFVVPVKSILDAGSKVAYESAEDTYVWEDLELFVTRQDSTGRVWGPHERLDRQTALKTATRWAADYVLKADKLGSIEPGKLADLVVLDRDYLGIPIGEVSETEPEMTIFDGRIVFVRTKFADEYRLRPNNAVVSTFRELKARRPARADDRTEAIPGEGL